MTAKDDYHCWCDAEALRPYSEDYLRCTHCETLISINRLADPKYQVSNDDTDYYGKQYWFQHQTTDLVLPNIEDRAESDLSGRCLWWLKTIMKFRLPGSTALDVGCSHGAMVFLLEQAGYAASGLELSRYIVDLAEAKFSVPIHCGPIETLPAPPGSLDLVCLFDVLEHLADPVATLSSCADLMSPDGVFVIQCPKYDPELTYKQLRDVKSPFLKMLIPEEHLFLFSIDSAKAIFSSLGFTHFREEPAYFSEHDMFFVASRKKLKLQSEKKIQSALSSAGRANQIQLLLRLFDSEREIQSTLSTVEADREARLQSIQVLTRDNAELEAAAKDRLALVDQLTKEIDMLTTDRKQVLRNLDDVTAENSELSRQIDVIDRDRAKQIALIDTLTSQATNLQADIDSLTADREQILLDTQKASAENAELLTRIAEIEADRATRASVIERLSSQLEVSQTENARLTADRSQTLLDTEKAAAENVVLLERVTEIEADRAERGRLVEELSGQVQRFKGDIDALTADRTQMLRDVQSVTAENAESLKRAEVLAADGQQRLLDIKKVAASNAELSAEIAVINSDRVARAALIETLSSQTESLQKGIDEIRADREQILSNLEQVSAENRELKKEIETINTDRSERLKVIESLAAEVQLQTEVVAKTESAKSALELEIAQLKAQLAGGESSQ